MGESTEKNGIRFLGVTVPPTDWVVIGNLLVFSVPWISDV